MRLALAVLFVIGPVSVAFAEEAPDKESSSGPKVPRDLFESLDFSKAKKGEWVEYEWSEDGVKVRQRLACVDIDETTIWLESNFTVKGFKAGITFLYGVQKDSGQIREAHCDAGGKVKTIALKSGSSDEPLELESLEAVAHGDDNQRAGDKTVPCQKIELTAKFRDDGGKRTGGPRRTLKLKEGDEGVKGRVLLWTSTKVPFPYRSWEASGWLLGKRGVKWKPKEPVCGGLVRVEVEAWDALRFRTKESVGKVVIRLVKFGTDAKPDLYLRK